MGGSGPYDDVIHAVFFTVLAVIYVLAIFMLITACIAEAALEDAERKLRQHEDEEESP